MLFNSVTFLLFFPIVVLLYYLLPHRNRWWLLLIASYYFYMTAKPEYGLLLLSSTTIAYAAGIVTDTTRNPLIRRITFIGQLVVLLGMLFVFKYLNFFSHSVEVMAQGWGLQFAAPSIEMELPVGISFFTFQLLSYVIDVYRRELKAVRHFGHLALYVSFFPQLVAGPIERSTSLLPQFLEARRFDGRRVARGLGLMLWGFSLKVVVADRLAIVVDQVYNNASSYQGYALVLATFFSAIKFSATSRGTVTSPLGLERSSG